MMGEEVGEVFYRGVFVNPNLSYTTFSNKETRRKE
jgi:hypothetical protein